jgi:cold-inducible RNA-binding protein
MPPTPPNCRLFVGNLDWDLTESELLAHFSASVPVRRATIMVDRSNGNPRGFGFIEVGNPADAETAINELAGSELMGRILTVNHARPKQPYTHDPMALASGLKPRA